MTLYIRLFLLHAVLSPFFFETFGQTPSTLPFQIFPQALPTGSFRHAVDISFGKPPEDLLEEGAYVRIPLAEYECGYSLPFGFSLYGKISTIVVSNHVSVGARWNWGIDHWAFSIGYDVAYLFGQLEQYGFNNSVEAWFNYPNVSVGYDFGKVAVTLRGELSIITSRSIFTDDIKVGGDKNLLNGGSVALFVEQPLWKNNYVILGFKAGYLRQWYPTWLAFSTFDRKFFVPEFIIGFVL
jgi:hypothetical protein